METFISNNFSTVSKSSSMCLRSSFPSTIFCRISFFDSVALRDDSFDWKFFSYLMHSSRDVLQFLINWSWLALMDRLSLFVFVPQLCDSWHTPEFSSNCVCFFLFDATSNFINVFSNQVFILTVIIFIYISLLYFNNLCNFITVFYFYKTMYMYSSVHAWWW